MKTMMPRSDHFSYALVVSEATPRAGQQKVKMKCLAVPVCALLCLFLAGCHTTASPPATYWAMVNKDTSCPIAGGFKLGCGAGTPEIWTEAGRAHPQFRLHFVEFDDQGWLHTMPRDNAQLTSPDNKPRTQIDAVLEDIASTLQKGRRVRLVIFVHGWKHSADPLDRDVVRFRELLSQFQTTRDAMINPKNQPEIEDETEFIGIYVGWRGRSWATDTYLTNLFLNATFWTRKATAIRVAQGQVRELFARVRGLQEYWDSEQKSPKCHAVSEVPDCKLRTVMIGHSFGAWILYAAVSQSIVEVLSMDQDLPKEAEAPKQPGGDVVKPSQRRRARLADMILLVNPAFEAVRYATVYEAARRQKAPPDSYEYEPPLLISITSTADAATRIAFPAGRSFNSALEHWSGDPQKEAMLRTPGHLPAYQTYRLDTVAGLTAEESKQSRIVPACEGWDEIGEVDPDDIGQHFVNKKIYLDNPENLEKQLRKNAGAESAARAAYFNDEPSRRGPSGRSPPRQFCGGLVLIGTGNMWNLPPNSPIWNITTSQAVIPDHSNFMTPEFFNFVKQIYGDRLQRRTKIIDPPANR